MMTNDDFYGLYAKYDRIVIRMEEKLLEARKRDLNKDFSEQQEVIDTLIHLREKFHQLYHLNLILAKNPIEEMIAQKKLLSRISRLEKENETLKQNITI